MHLRGKSARLEIVRKSGIVDEIGWIPLFDYNWQNVYRFETPVVVDKGEIIKMTLIYDNSKFNIANPNPEGIVGWGRQTWNEMFFFEIDYRYVSKSEVEEMGN